MKRLLLLIAFGSISCYGQKKTANDPKSDTLGTALFDGLKFRSIGPAITSGRIVDIAVNPANQNEYYVAAAANGVWKTTNAGTTYEQVFRNEGSYSIGCITIDPNNTNTIWVGSGENNNQRSVSYGDGLYKSEDGGKSWKNVGLAKSEHIGTIAVNPQNSEEVFVAAYGPLWSSGGDRGIYKTADGGKTWKQILFVSENTGFNEVHLDPRYPNIVYATAHQRQRKVFTYVGGGPESAMYKSTDGGQTWNKIMKGLPENDLGRIGMAISPVNPDVLYSIVEGEGGGVFKSTDRGSSWKKQSTYQTQGNYYQEIICDPKDVNKLYSMTPFLQVTLDGGKTWKTYGEKNKHIDNHVIWIDPSNTDHTMVGCDGGLYETWDNAENWQFKPNLPITQFYKVVTDNALPFYNVFGGTQDNFSLGGPSRTISGNGIVNSDWYITNGGDGFESAVDPEDPNIIYAQAQYGALVRYDKKSGENLVIQNIEAPGQPAFRWNWDAPLQVSCHKHTRLYHAAQYVFRSDDRGGTWQTISPDLSRGVDRNKIPVMGRIWSVDAVAKNGSTDVYGQVTAFSESPLDENLLVAGTDDGLVHITTNGGKNWTKVDKIPGIPELCYVHTVLASRHDKNVIYVVFNNHRMGDFRPYLVKSSDGGKTWSGISGNLPQRGSTYCIAEDHVKPSLLFAGTEFGVYATVDGGARWVQLKGGLPTIAVRDIEIQRRENDLVLATFGSGFYVLDDYSPLRNLASGDLAKRAFILPVKDALMFVQSFPLGLRGKSFQGSQYFSVPNPTPGAVFTWYVKDELKTLKQKRKDAEKELVKIKKDVYYPPIDSLRMEDNQPEPYLLFTITDDQGQVIRKIKTKYEKGLQRQVWDFRYAPFTPVNFTIFDPEVNLFSNPDAGFMALPGDYKVSLSKWVDGQLTELVAPQAFKCVGLNNATLPATDKKELMAFNKKVAEMQRVVTGTEQYRGEINNRLKYVRQALIETPENASVLSKKVYDLEQRMAKLNVDMNGDPTLQSREFEALQGINGLISNTANALWTTTAAPTATMESSYQQAATKFAKAYNEVKAIDSELKTIEQQIEKAGGPYTPGRLPDWKPM